MVRRMRSELGERAAFRIVQLWMTIVALVLAPLFFGSVDLFWISVWTILLSTGVLCGVAVPMGTGQSRILLGFLTLCGIYTLVAIIQITPHLMGELNDPSWQKANDLLDLNVLPRISSRAEFPPLAAGHFLLFATSFINGFLVGTSKHSSAKLIQFAHYSILLYAIYGLAALIFTPNMVLWVPKVAYHGSLTATFINHNTAATFVGTGAILWFCYAFSLLQSFRFSSIRLLLMQSNEHRVFKIITRSSGALVCFFALLLTGSRGGLICSCLGLLVAIILMISNKQKQSFWYVVASGGVALAVVVAWLSRIGRIGSQGLLDDARWSVYGICVDAIWRRPLLGSGVGTFADLFPSLRTDNFPSWGVWDYAHSTVLEVAVEMGIPVAAMIVIAGLLSLFILGRAAVIAKDRSRRLLAATTGIAVLGYLHSMIDFSLQIPGYLIVFGILLGCGLARASATETRGSAAGMAQSSLKSA